ncbi:MAG: transposase [Pseudomonadota bacterium]
MFRHHVWLTDEQFAHVQPLLPNKPRGVRRVDDRRGIIDVIRNGLMRRDAPERYGPNETLYKRFVRRLEIGVFDRIVAALTAERRATEIVMFDATHLKAKRRAAGYICSRTGAGLF